MRYALSILSTAALALIPFRVGNAQTPFQIIVEKTETGVSLQCTKGCSWKTATYSCTVPSRSYQPVIIMNGVIVSGENGAIESGTPVPSDSLSGCRFQINDRGVAPAPQRFRSPEIKDF